MNWRIHPEVIGWAPSAQERRTIEEAFPFPARVEIWPRRLLGQRTGKIAGPYAFRAISRGDEALVFADETETRASIAWLIAHELAHHELARNPRVREFFVKARPIGIDPASDQFHEEDPEERYADGRATALFGTRYDRAWWRRHAG